ncbi:Crp/Fnr family transcriptional regulator [Thalassospira profundimaris]|uniref:Crp/Fnr family transcriptional regulator n=1 Tax=Thalassospira profundimaris TaxID=502049 RepID=UPI00028730A2|nr:Crp/Fnr family transcriptional regulator [Thalassospira profundimaris]EKF09722.1 Crp/FNR family transcriptional regulator [Thalassospira profundimaris WP0211]
MNHTASYTFRPELARCRECGVRKFALFNNLTDEDLKLVHMPVEDITLPKRNTLYNAGDQAQSIFTLRSGLVKLVHYLPDGNQRVVRLVKPGGTIGLEALVSDCFTHHAEALQDSRLCRIPIAVIEKLDNESPRLHKQVLNRWHQAVMESDNWLTQMSTGTARERVARLCLFLHDDVTESCTVPGREDIGAMLGITTETASRIIADFRRHDLLEFKSRNVFKLDLVGLREVAGMDAADEGNYAD